MDVAFTVDSPFVSSYPVPGISMTKEQCVPGALQRRPKTLPPSLPKARVGVQNPATA